MKVGNIYQQTWNNFSDCGRKRCDCYIAYCHLNTSGIQTYMQQNNLWRIPVRHPVKAAFFDIDGTLVTKEKVIPDSYRIALQQLAERIPLFLATALPVSYAKKRLGDLFSLFQGGVYADGGHLIHKDSHTYIPISTIPEITRADIRIKTYKAGKTIYKYTLTTPSIDVTQTLKEYLVKENNYRIFTKGRLLTLTHPEASKRNGLLTLCKEIDVHPSETLAIGDT
ncbi:MAG: HAD hydrolase family protein, partial [Tannerellaceae bacterium]|nr:HAD hydrolase family protein [Tannerellaceae bacterium]